MKATLLLTVIACLFLCSRIQAQWSAGISAGYTNNEFYTNISNYDYNYYKKEGGFLVAVPVQYAITKWFGLQAEPGFIQKSFLLQQALPTNPSTHLTSRYNYLQLPLIVHLHTGINKWQGFVNFGSYAAYWLSGHIKGTELDGFNYTNFPGFLNATQDVDDKYAFDSRRDRRLQYGWLGGIGVQYTLNKKLDVFLEGRYSEDLTDQQKKYMHNQMPRYNITTSLTAGCFYHFSSNKHN